MYFLKALTSYTVTVQLICAFVFAYTKSRFSHDAAHILLQNRELFSAIFSHSKNTVNLQHNLQAFDQSSGKLRQAVMPSYDNLVHKTVYINKIQIKIINLKSQLVSNNNIHVRQSIASNVNLFFPVSEHNKTWFLNATNTFNVGFWCYIG